MPDTVLTVPDISCDHCKNAIETEVGALDGVDSAVVDVEQRTVSVAGPASVDAVVAAINEAGYEVASS